jgi:hypothetical protein
VNSTPANRYTLTYDHDELILWCNHPDHHLDDQTSAWENYSGGPDLLSALNAAAAKHDAEQHGGEQ